MLVTLKRMGNPRFRAEMETRYGIVTKDAFGVHMNEMQRVGKQLGRNHALALALWETGNYVARTVAAFVAEPERVTPALMDRWCSDFDNWAICDTVCFKLFDQLPHAFAKVGQWAGRHGELEKRAAFALLACLALHDKRAGNSAFISCLPLIKAESTDERNFVKKAASRVPGGGVGQLSVSGAEFWVAEESPPHLNFSPESLVGCSVRMLLIVEDPAAMCAQAVRAGATQVVPVADARCWRLGRILDPFGHHWEIGRPLS